MNILLSGPAGIGTTTDIVRLARVLAGRCLALFYIEELCAAGQRRGFRAETLGGHS
jgi:nucleoside-triphosphatase THEP1